MRSVNCGVCGVHMGYTKAMHVPVLYHNEVCADQEVESEHAERDDLIELLARDFDSTPTEISIILDGRGWRVTAQRVHQIVREKGANNEPRHRLR